MTLRGFGRGLVTVLGYAALLVLSTLWWYGCFVAIASLAPPVQP